MMNRTILAALGAAALWAVPMTAQDTTTTKPDTTGARTDSVAVIAPVPDTTARKDTVAVIVPAPDTSTARRDTAAAIMPAPPAADTAAGRQDTVSAVTPSPETPAAAQANGTAVSPGMTEADVRARWGEPIAIRTANEWTYLFYRNARERQVGMYDVVLLQRGQVMDAIVRSPEHVYAGQSSSPEGRVPVFTPPQQPEGAAPGAAVTGVRVKPSP